MDSEDLRIENTIRLLKYAIIRGVAIDPHLALDALEGRLTQTDLGLPIFKSTEVPE